MKLTVAGKDIITITDNDLKSIIPTNKKVHIIRLSLKKPSVQSLDHITSCYHKTQRYVVDNEFIRFYNGYFKGTNIKYYVINTHKMYSGIVSFFKRNNKVLLDVTKLDMSTRSYISDFTVLVDLLSNLEVILIDEDDYKLNKNIYNNWNGNVIIQDKEYII